MSFKNRWGGEFIGKFLTAFVTSTTENLDKNDPNIISYEIFQTFYLHLSENVVPGCATRVKSQNWTSQKLP